MQIQTNRLKLIELTTNDVDNFFLLDSNPEVMKYLGRPPVKDKNEVRAAIEKKMNYGKANPGLSFWVLIEKEKGLFVGQFSLSHIEYDQAKEIEIGFRLLPNFWGKGFATEMGDELIKYGFDHLKLEKIVGLTQPGNLASQRVLERLGLKYIRDEFHYNTKVRFFEIRTRRLPDE